MGLVHHLALPGEGARALARVLFEGRDEREGILGVGLGGRELLVDHFDLARMDRQLPAEAHGHAFPALAPQPFEIGNIRVDGVEPFYAGRRGRHCAHDTRVAGNVQIAPRLIPNAGQAHGRPQVLDAPGQRGDPRAGRGDLADVEEPARRLRGDEDELGRPEGDPVFLLEPLEGLRHLAHVGGRARLGHQVSIGPGGDGLLQVGDGVLGEDRIHPHPPLAPAEVEGLEPATHDGPRRGLQ